MKYQFEFEYCEELDLISKILHEAQLLDNRIKKHLLNRTGIRFNELPGINVLWIDLDQPAYDMAVADKILQDNSVFESCLNRLGIKTIQDDSSN